MDFRDLVAALPRGDEKFKPEKLPAGLSYVESVNRSFVEPGLNVETPIEQGRSSVLLLTAPGAVGKSTLAGELARQTGAVLWDLSAINVGSGTFSGKILEAYDLKATGVLKRLKTGEFLFILDALDEAQVRAGSQNFDAFLADIATAFHEPRAKPTLVLLARTDTADWVYLTLEDADVPVARLRIDYFEEPQAISFIDRRLDALHERDSVPATHRGQRKPFSDVRAEVFRVVYDLFDVAPNAAWQDRRVRDFLGYAPVLEAVAEYLYVGNYAALLEELRKQAAAARNPWQFLADIVGQLQVREQKKVAKAARERLGAKAADLKWAQWDSLYQSDEQCARVLGHALRQPSGAAPKSLQSSMASEYEDTLSTILPQHPFLSGRRFANVVFREFAYAWGVTRADERMADAVRAVMRSREELFLPSPLFAEFVISLLDQSTPTLDGQDFGIVYESFLSRNRKVETSLIATDDGIAASIIVSDEQDSVPELQLLDTGAGVHFWRRLCEADIDVGCTVRVGLPDQRFALGPAVEVGCGELVIGCDDVAVDRTRSVSLAATAYSSTGSNLKLRVWGPETDRFRVDWPGVGHPWTPYRGRAAAVLPVLADTLRGDALRKFVLMFRRQRSRREQTVQQARWSPEQLGDRDDLLRIAFEHGVLARNARGRGPA